MRILLDTHVFVWAVSDHPRLSARARRLIEEAETVYVSAVSIWEIAIKSALGKIEANVEELGRSIGESGFIELPMTKTHAMAVSRLAPPQHHKDPFDRMLVAQSMVEPLVLISADPNLESYGGLIQLV